MGSMGLLVSRRFERLTMIGLCGTVLMNTAIASPPIGRSETHRLDLRAPAAPAVAAKAYSGNFSPSRGQISDGQDQVQFAGLSTQDPQMRTTTRAQDLVQRVRREGLPIARLWENKSALVSLGLNQKGKPGLWITQKFH
jgi:hypothetical protein